MFKYPLKPDTEQKVERYVKYNTALEWCNQSFYDGFMAAHFDTAEEWEKMTITDRINFCFAAIERCGLLRRDPPIQFDFSEILDKGR